MSNGEGNNVNVGDWHVVSQDVCLVHLAGSGRGGVRCVGSGHGGSRRQAVAGEVREGARHGMGGGGHVQAHLVEQV